MRRNQSCIVTVLNLHVFTTAASTAHNHVSTIDVLTGYRLLMWSLYEIQHKTFLL